VIRVCTPLWAEWAAVRSAGVHAVRVGAGPGARAVPGPVVVCGVAGAVDPRLRPGDVVVADEIRSDAGVFAALDPAGLAAAVRARGLRVHVGPVWTAPRVVTGPARQALPAIAVDTESAFLAAHVHPCGVVRAVVDGPGRELVRVGTVWRGTVALWALRGAAAGVRDWTRGQLRERV
jgi:4-hydroxy-3-methylbut-2-en-1-yl diphosphate reductase